MSNADQQQQQQQYTDGEYGEQQYYAEGNYTEESYQQDEMMGENAEPQHGEQAGVNGTTVAEAVATKSPSDEDRKLFIGGISWDTEQKDLKEYFSKYGEVTDVTIKTDPNTGKSRGFGFITFSSEETVETVLKNVPHTIKGKQVDPKRAKARPGVKKIFVGGLEADIPEADIKTYFEKYGKVESVELPFDKLKNQRRQFCFVTFESEDACEEACKLAKQKIGTKECDIKKATMKPDPRSARGGWGATWSPRAARGRGRGRGAFGQSQGWAAQGYGGYGQGYGGYGQGYSGYGNYGYDYSGYGGSYGGGYGDYDYSGWSYGQGGYGGGYGQQQSTYGKALRRGGTAGYHPYSR